MAAEATASATSEEKPSAARESYLREFNRFELKYRSTFRERDRLLETIGPFLRVDANASADGRYGISSRYYDSPGFESYWEKIDGVKWRRKLRLRVYPATPEVAYLEIKQRIDKTVQKRRVQMPLEEAEAWLLAVETDPPESPDAPDPVLREIEYLFKTKHIKPQIVISYQREAFFAAEEKGLRITFDSRLKYRAANLSLSENLAEEGHYICHPEEVIIEIKFNDRIPLWTCSAIRHLEMQAERVSKYCFGVNSCFYENDLKL